MKSGVAYFFCFLFASLLIKVSQLHGQQSTRLLVKERNVLILPDTTIVVRNDSMVILPVNTPFKILDISDFGSAAFYDSLRNQPDQSMIKSTLYKYLLAKSSSNDKYEDFQKAETIFLPFEGRIIDRIRLKNVRVLSGSVYDTLEVNETGFSALLNTMHFQTRNLVIRNNLLFKVGEKIDPYVLADNERILRELPYLEDASIVINPLPDEQRVEVIVITKDLFSIGLSPTVIDARRYRVAVFDRNFFGLGTELRYQVNYNANEKPPVGHEIKYAITNIRGTFIAGTLSYRKNFDGKFGQILFEKQFLTPQTRYAGAVDLGLQNTANNEFQYGNWIWVPYTRYYQDYWAGRSFLIGHDHSRKNIMLTGRIRFDHFTDRPFVSADSNFFYHNTRLLLASLSYREVNYFKSSMILSFGTTEDIPVGYLLQLTGGFEKEEFADKPYIGGTMARAVLWPKIGFLGGTISYGTFIRQEKMAEGILKMNSLYFSPLARMNRYRLRQLVSFEYIRGLNFPEYQTIDLKGTVRGLSGHQVVGTSRMTFSLESVLFAPWNLLGFRFALYGFGDFAFISRNPPLLYRDNFFSSFGIGCRIRNESLVLKTLQIRIFYLPHTPDNAGEWNINVNSRNESVLDPFTVSRPEIISYR